MQGIVFDIKRFAVHDGPGIRTTVHMKGCPLKCIWCHNPESIDPNPVMVTKIAKMGDLSFKQEELVGETYEAGDLLELLMKDQVFWEESEGGVTFSGGEPFLQFPFLKEMIVRLKERGVHICIDTCGVVSREKLNEIAPLVDLFLFDLKAIDSEQHRDFTGADNQLILDNMNWLINHKYKVRVRIPVIPTKNFEDRVLDDYLEFLESKNVEGVDLLPYHAIASAKYKRFEIPNEMKKVQTLEKEELKSWQEKLEAAGFSVSIGG